MEMGFKGQGVKVFVLSDSPEETMLLQIDMIIQVTQQVDYSFSNLKKSKLFLSLKFNNFNIGICDLFEFI